LALGRCGKASLVFFVAVFLVLLVHQYVEFNKPSLVTLGLGEENFSASIILLDDRLSPVICRINDSINITIDSALRLSITGKGYSVYDTRIGAEVFRAVIRGGEVFARTANGSYERLHFSPFLDIWPNKPPALVQLLGLYEPRIEYLRDVFGASSPKYSPKYGWVYSEKVRTPNGIVDENDVALIESRPIVVNYTISVGGLPVSERLEFSVIDGEYKGSIPLESEFILPARLVEKHYLAKLASICNIDPGRVAYVRIFLINMDTPLYSRSLNGWLFTLYPLLGALAATVLGGGLCAARGYLARRHG